METTTMQVRINNRNLILQYLKENPSVTKAIVSKGTGLSQGTVNTILNQLKEELLVCEDKEPNLSGGRPAQTFYINEDYCHICCIYMEENDKEEALVHYGIMNLRGHTPLKEKIIIPNITPGKLISFISDLRKRDAKIFAVGIAIPGIVDKDGVIGHCDFSAFANVSLSKHIQDSLSISVHVDNEVNLMARGVADLNQVKSNTAAVLYFPKSSALGVGLICDGRILRGATGFAGELSFLPPGFREIPDETMEELSEHVAYMINVLTCVINPEEIVLNGERISKLSLEDLENRCLKYIPLKHLPRLVYQENIYDYCIHGVWKLIEERYLSRLGEL